MITDYERESNPEVVEAVEELIGSRNDGDLFRSLMEYLNNRKTQSEVKANAEELSEAFLNFLMQVQADADSITEYIQNQE